MTNKVAIMRVVPYQRELLGLILMERRDGSLVPRKGYMEKSRCFKSMDPKDETKASFRGKSGVAYHTPYHFSFSQEPPDRERVHWRRE